MFSGSLASGPSSYEVASPASQELYVFDTNGTHQFTMSLVTGDYKYNFSYRFVYVELNMYLLWWEKIQLLRVSYRRLSTFLIYILCKTCHISRNYSVLACSSFFTSKKVFSFSKLCFCPCQHCLKYFSLCSLTLSNEEDVTAVTDSSGNTLRIRRDTNRMPVRVVAPDNQVR